MLLSLAPPGLYSMMTIQPRGATYGAGDPETPRQKGWPLMTPAERLAIWEEARHAWTHDAKDVIAYIERGRAGAGMERP
jgi:hypothetical protein